LQFGNDGCEIAIGGAKASIAAAVIGPIPGML
jgi:hypothetical protein